ncbi:MAG: MFS transporter [Chloroflexi bacterium]|nr:MFS transporter [Chloroflexota bacterium]
MTSKALATVSVDDRARRRIVWTLFTISAFGSTGYLAAVTAGTLAAAEIAGSAAPGGFPTATSTLGTAMAASLLSILMVRTGRRPGLLVGIGIGVFGGAVALAGVLVASLPLLLLGSGLAGFANGSAQLGRYVAADMFPAARRASTIGTVVWGSTVGAVIGPSLVAPAGQVATALGLPALAGTYAATVMFIGLGWLVAFVFLRPEPYRLADASHAEREVERAPSAPLAALIRRPTVIVAFAALATGQVVMMLIMTMTPLHLAGHGHGLTIIGVVLSAHVLGMFALSPLSGRLTDRFGSPRIIGVGFAILAASALMAAAAPPAESGLLIVALFLLGFGWNLGFVAGSALLTRDLRLAERTRVQGVADGLVWTTAAAAGVASGLIVAGTSYSTLGLLGIGLLLPAAGLLIAWRRSLAVPRAA